MRFCKIYVNWITIENICRLHNWFYVLQTFFAKVINYFWLSIFKMNQVIIFCLKIENLDTLGFDVSELYF